MLVNDSNETTAFTTPNTLNAFTASSSGITISSLLTSAATVAVVLIGIVVNSLGICVLIKTNKVVSHNARLFLICLNTADFLNCVNYGIVAPVTLALNLQEWPFPEWLCSAHTIVTNFTQATSYYFVLSIAVDRYIAVVYPLRYEELFTQTRAHLLVAGILTMSVAFEIGGKEYEYLADIGTCWLALRDRPTAIVHTSLVTVVAVIPFFAVIGMYMRIVMIARRHSRVIAAQELSTQHHHHGDVAVENRRTKPDSKAIVTFFMITGVFGTAFIPYYATLFYVIDTLHWPATWWIMVLRLQAVCNTWFNALVYYFRNKWFKEELKQLLSCSGCRSHPGDVLRD